MPDGGQPPENNINHEVLVHIEHILISQGLLKHHYSIVHLQINRNIFPFIDIGILIALNYDFRRGGIVYDIVIRPLYESNKDNLTAISKYIEKHLNQNS